MLIHELPESARVILVTERWHRFGVSLGHDGLHEGWGGIDSAHRQRSWICCAFAGIEPVTYDEGLAVDPMACHAPGIKATFFA
jgi:hypothetical protein